MNLDRADKEGGQGQQHGGRGRGLGGGGEEEEGKLDQERVRGFVKMTNCRWVDWPDLSRKIRALMHFASKLGADYGDGRGGVDCRNRYKDQLFAFVDGRSEKAQRPIDLVWISPGLDSTEVEDRRPHEAMIRENFSQYSLVIKKDPGVWTCTINTPVPEAEFSWVCCRVACQPKRDE